MNITINSKILSSVLSQMQRVVSSKAVLPILGCYRIEVCESGKLAISASDNEHTAQITLDTEGVQGAGVVCVDARRFTDLIKRLDGVVNIDFAEDKKVTVKTEHGRYSLTWEDADAFPTNTSVDAPPFALPTDTVLAGIEKTLFAVANDTLRPVMNGIYWDFKDDEITFVGSDGHKLVKYHVPNIHATGGSFITSAKTAGLIRTLFAKEPVINVYAGTSSAVMMGENIVLSFRFIEGRFPNYNSVIPTGNDKVMTVNKNDLLQRLDRVQVMGDERSYLVRMVIGCNKLEVISENMDFATSASETMTCESDFAMTIGFKSTTLIELLRNIDSKDVVFALSAPERAAVLFPSEQGECVLTELLMPMMIE